MKHSDFEIGMAFRCSGWRWLVTDVGQRTVVAIRYKKGWTEWLPYSVTEVVFDEEDFPACEPVS